MKGRLFPLNDPAGRALFAGAADALAHAAFAPARDAVAGEVAAAREPRIGFWDRLDRWAWNLMQKEREAYLARAQNLADLEERLRDLDSYRGRFY
jgi:hypothetical protein